MSFVAESQDRNNLMFKAKEVTNPSHEKAAGELTLDLKIPQWLQNFGFAYNPFQFSHSERDNRLDRYYVAHPAFFICKEEDNNFIFARPGAGKSALRLQLEGYFRDVFPSNRVFAFSYTPSERFIKNTPNSFIEYIPSLLKDSIQNAFLWLSIHGADFSQKFSPEIISQFGMFFNSAYSGLYDVQNILEACINSNSLRPILQATGKLHEHVKANKHQLSKSIVDGADEEAIPDSLDTVEVSWLEEWLDLLNQTDANNNSTLPKEAILLWHSWIELLMSIGIKSVVILADEFNIQSKDLKNTKTQKIVTGVQPLAAAILKKNLGDQVFAKFFLPIESQYPLKESLITQFKVNTYPKIVHLDWNNEQLYELLEARLRYATGDVIRRFAQLCEEYLSDIDDYLIVTANGSPRVLIHAINSILKLHVSKLSNPKYESLDRILLQTVSKHFEDAPIDRYHQP